MKFKVLLLPFLSHYPLGESSSGAGETGWTWDLGPFVAVLAPGQNSPPATEYKETIRA